MKALSQFEGLSYKEMGSEMSQFLDKTIHQHETKKKKEVSNMIGSLLESKDVKQKL
jgi:hypothetical protein